MRAYALMPETAVETLEAVSASSKSSPATPSCRTRSSIALRLLRTCEASLVGELKALAGWVEACEFGIWAYSFAQLGSKVQGAVQYQGSKQAWNGGQATARFDLIGMNVCECMRMRGGKAGGTEG